MGDSLISSHISKKGNIGTNDMLVKMANTQTFTRTKQYQYGNVIFGITIRGELDLVNGANANKLMEDVQFNSPIVEFNILESKADLILNDLSSKDSAVVEEAYDEARTARFDSSNIAALHECLLKKYPAPFEYGSVSDINERIAYRLATLASPSTITFVCTNYDGLVGDKEYIRTSLLELLSKITTKQSYDSLFCLLKKHPADKLPISFAANITDSLKLTANYSEDILGYIKDTARGMQMTTIVNRLNDSSLITLNRIRQCEKDFIVLSKYDLSRSEHNWRSSNLVEILGKIKTQNSFAAIRGYLNVKDVKYVKKKAAITLIKNNQPVSAVVLNNMAADRELRSLLYEDLKDMKKQALFPKLYLTQKSLGESDLYNVASDENEIKAIKFIAEKTATYKNKKYKFYLFKVTFEEDGGSYLGIAGAYDIAGKYFEPKEDITSLHYDEEFDAAKITGQFNDWLESFEKEE